MLFKYKIIENTGEKRDGVIEAVNMDTAISSLQRRGFVVSSIRPAEDTGFLEKNFSFFEGVSVRDLVIFSRQIATLFAAQVPAFRSFMLLGQESEDPVLRRTVMGVADELQAGSSISNALAKYPKVFSNFYVNMVRSGEESGELNKVFIHLAENAERNYRLTSKAKNAFIYPVFVVIVLIAVMILMMTTVIPKLTEILIESGQEIPFFTKIVIGVSDFFINYGLILLVFLVIGGFFSVRFLMTEEGEKLFSSFKLSIPYVGNLYKKLYLARIANNMNIMLSSGIPMLRAFEITVDTVGDDTYKNILQGAIQDIRGGSPVSNSLSGHAEIPGVMIQMIKVGEETGNLGEILKTLADFYEREVMDSVDTLVSLIEPALIVVLAVGVGILLVAVVVPMYNITAGI